MVMETVVPGARTAPGAGSSWVTSCAVCGLGAVVVVVVVVVFGFVVVVVFGFVVVVFGLIWVVFAVSVAAVGPGRSEE